MNASRTPAHRRPGSTAVLDWLRLARVYQKIERAAMEQLREWDLSLAQFDILAHLGAADGPAQQELAQVRLTTKGNLSQLLDHLERADLICRVREGRLKRVYLTDSGRRLYQTVVPLHEEVITAQFAALSAAEQGELLGLLRTLDRALPAP